MRRLLLAVLLAFACQALAADPPTATDFRAELKAMLERSKAERKGLEFHVNGQTLAGGVVTVLDDAVVVANQQYGRVLIRLDRIDAVAGF
jgi:hypothetical protein